MKLYEKTFTTKKSNYNSATERKLEITNEKKLKRSKLIPHTFENQWVKGEIREFLEKKWKQQQNAQVVMGCRKGSVVWASSIWKSKAKMLKNMKFWGASMILHTWLYVTGHSKTQLRSKYCMKLSTDFVYIKHKCILCLDLGPIPKISHYIFQTLKYLKIPNTSGFKHKGYSICNT